MWDGTKSTRDSRSCTPAQPSRCPAIVFFREAGTGVFGGREGPAVAFLAGCDV